MLEVCKYLEVRRTWNASEVTYEFSNSRSGEHQLSLKLPEAGSDWSGSSQRALDAFVGLFLAQLTLARNLRLHYPAALGEASTVTPLLDLLYKVRCYRDNIDIVSPPTISCERSQGISATAQRTSDPKKVVLLWSGGVDSTLSLLSLLANGFEVTPVHIRLNASATYEDLAVTRIEERLGIRAIRVELDFPDYMAIAREYSNRIGNFPTDNPVPHGRELLLVPLAALYAESVGARYLCYCPDSIAWSKQVSYRGYSFARYDTQSEQGAHLLQDTLAQLCGDHLRLTCPSAALSDFRKFHDFARTRPDLLQLTSSCFWENRCGQCEKCITYYLYQRSLNLDLLRFRVNPLSAPPSWFTELLGERRDTGRDLWTDIHYAMSQICLSQTNESDDYLFRTYRLEMLPCILPQLAEIESRVFALRDVSLQPTGYRYPFWDLPLHHSAT